MPGIGEFRHVVTVQASQSIPDGDGGTIEVWTDLAPVWHVAIQPAPVRDLERLASSTIVAIATHIIHGRDRADVTIKCRVLWDARIFNVAGLARPFERPIDLYLFAKEAI